LKLLDASKSHSGSSQFLHLRLEVIYLTCQSAARVPYVDAGSIDNFRFFHPQESAKATLENFDDNDGTFVHPCPFLKWDGSGTGLKKPVVPLTELDFVVHRLAPFGEDVGISKKSSSTAAREVAILITMRNQTVLRSATDEMLKSFSTFVCFATDTVLTVIETRSSDSGIYVCVATNEAGTTQQAFTLEVLAPCFVPLLFIDPTVAPRIVATSPNESVVPVNNPFSLKCGVRGYPFPEIIWTIDDKPVEAELGGGFSIGPPFVTKEGLKTINSTEGDPSLLDGAPISSSPNVEISDGGTQLKIHSSKLHDEVPPRITEKPRRIIVKSGQPAELWCEAVGIPQPQIRWLKDDVALPQNVVITYKSQLAAPKTSRLC
uniref:Ig-like domain-containing protein n=1 Tax=Parascaris equorum TaxID=6256 RepID=A0A914S869_PAREQ